MPDITIGFYHSSNVMRPVLSYITAELIFSQSFLEGLVVGARRIEYIQ
jgi:hypothetical protein